MICRSFLAMVSYNGETFVFKVDFEDGYGFFLEKVCCNWSILRERSICVYYSVRNKSRCCLRCDEDFGCLVTLVKLLNMEYVDFDIIDKDVLDGSGSCQTSVASSSSSAIVDVRHADDFVSSFCKHDKKDLLTKGWETLIKGVGQRFDGGAEEFRLCLRKVFVGSGHDFKYAKNYAGRVKAVCVLKEDRGCPWMVSASTDPSDGSFHVRKLVNVHTCHDGEMSFKNRNMTSDVVANLIEADVRAKRSLRPVDVVKEISSHYGVSISYTSAVKSVEKAKNIVYGSEGDTFEHLRWYVESTMETNPGSHVVRDVDESSGRFVRIFVAYEACIRGFSYCRPMLFLDGTHLKAAYKGHLLSAVGKDGNQGLYPLCFGIVDSENSLNWEWFLENLKQILDLSRVFTFISDRNIGLVEFVPKVFPNSFHCFCLLHLKMNLRDRLSRSRFGKGMRARLVHLFEECAFAPTVEYFNERMDEFCTLGGTAVSDFLVNMPPDKWANAHFKGKRYGEMYSNAVESFNNWIVHERELPVGTLVDLLRIKITKQISDRSSLAERWTDDLCFEINRRLSDKFMQGIAWPIVLSSPLVFEVQCNPSVKVDLSKGCCSCYAWQLHGFPCVHAVVCIRKIGQKCSSYVEPWFHVATYRMCYSSYIQPIPTVFKPKSVPEEKRVLPPYSKRPPGRPKNKRIRSRGEFVSSIKCGRCGRLGNHNSRTCKVALLM